MLRVAVVDAYSSGNLFAAELKTRGYIPIHIQSSEKIPDGYFSSFRNGDFEQNLVLKGVNSESIEKLALELKALDVICIIPGSEPGVMLCDFLSEKLKLTSNGTRFSLARRNKFEMLEQVARMGISTPKQSLHTSCAEAIAWTNSQSTYPVVVKPVNSAGTDCVAICQNQGDVEVAFDAIYGKTNRLAQINNSVLLQEYLLGTEYAVNTVSNAGKHFTSSIWKYVKTLIPGTEINFYDRDVLLSPIDPVFDVLSIYATEVLNALHLNHGPAHIEIMMTKEGPKLIELGARMSGATMSDLDFETAGFGQVDLSLDAYLDHSSFIEKTCKPRKLSRVAELVTIRNEFTGIILDCSGLNEIYKLKSYFSSRIKFRAGDFLPPTRNVFTSPGFVILSNSDPQQLAADTSRIREIEAVGIFTLKN